MPTRRRFLASLASLAAAAGLARFARGGAETEPPPAAPPKVPEPHPDAGFYVPFACVMPDGRVRNRIGRFDERGRLVEVSGLLPEA